MTGGYTKPPLLPMVGQWIVEKQGGAAPKVIIAVEADTIVARTRKGRHTRIALSQLDRYKGVKEPPR